MSAGLSQRDPVDVLEKSIEALFSLGMDDLSDELEVVLLEFKRLRSFHASIVQSKTSEREK